MQSSVMRIAALTRRYELPSGRVELLGASHSVTGAMTRVEWGSDAILVDCGIAQGNEARRWRFPEAAHGAHALVLTHAHLDHVGALPALFEGGFAGPIVATRVTLQIVDLVVTDSLRLAGASSAEIQAFRLRLREQSHAVRYDEAVQLPGRSTTVIFREAGHILGSASVDLSCERSRVICSGDLGRPDSPLLRDYARRWPGEKTVDLAIMESTYGDRDHSHSHDDVEHELERILLRAISTGGHVLVPAFAIGRTQTLLYHLNTLVESGRIPSIPVAVDTPMGLRVTEIYAGGRRLFDRDALERIAHGDDPLDFENLYAVQRARDSRRLRDVDEPMVIIAGSGMCTGGRIVGHLKELLPLPETCVLFVGFQAPGTPGQAIQRAAARGGVVRLDGDEIAVRAEIETLSGLSAHADRGELRDWLIELPPVRTLGLHHGEPDAQRALAEWLKSEIDPSSA